MDNRPPLLNWRLRLIWLRSLLVLAITLALIVLQRFGHTGYQLAELGWLGALLLPNLVTLFTRKVHGRRHSQKPPKAAPDNVNGKHLKHSPKHQGYGHSQQRLSVYPLMKKLPYGQ